MDRKDVEIEEYEEIIGDLERQADHRNTEEARAVSFQEPTPSNPEILMTHRATDLETSIREPSR